MYLFNNLIIWACVRFWYQIFITHKEYQGADNNIYQYIHTRISSCLAAPVKVNGKKSIIKILYYINFQAIR